MSGSSQVSLTEGPVADLISVVRDLDVNRLADAMKRAQDLSKEHPGVIFFEVDKADAKVHEAISALLEAQSYLRTGIGALILRAD